MIIDEVVVTNIHKNSSGVSISIQNLLPIQNKNINIQLIDKGGIHYAKVISIWKTILGGFKKHPVYKNRIWHARRSHEMLLGILLKKILRQKWRLIYTDAKAKPHNPVHQTFIRQMDYVIGVCDRQTRTNPYVNEIINHGVDISRFTPSHVNTSRNIQEFNAKYIILSCGRIRYSKGTDLFVNELIPILHKFRDFSAVWIGMLKKADKIFFRDLQKRIKDAGMEERIFFLGHKSQDEVIEYLQNSHLLFAPSRREGFGLTALEAMSCGVPVLSSDQGVWPELIQPNQTGDIFHSNDPSQITHKLTSLLQYPDLLEKMGKAARKHVEEHYPLTLEAAKINAVYKKLLQQ